MQVAVIGAGFQGTCVALELARRGVKVELFDLADQPITKAGLVNEGRIHLGFTYAKDTSLKTARKMIHGALGFRSGLNRWIDFDGLLPEILTDPSYYAVHKQGQLSLEQVWNYQQNVASLLKQAFDKGEGDYLGQVDGFICERVAPENAAGRFDMTRITGVMETMERSVDVKPIARSLREALAANAQIAFHAATRVTGVVEDGAGLVVEFDQQGAGLDDAFDHVVNAAWSGRLAIDAAMGLAPAKPVLHRFKLGVWIASAKFNRSAENVTIVQGPYGDIVPFPSGETYMSWYPDCMIARSDMLEPPDWPAVPDSRQAAEIAKNTVTALTRFFPTMAAISAQDLTRAQVKGGVITAWGREDIDSPGSELHKRHDNGVHTYGRRYHSIDTGKYTLAPVFALEASDRICGSG